MLLRALSPKNVVRPVILRSWRRSQRIDPGNVPKEQLSPQKIKIRQTQNSYLMTAAKSIMEDICRVPENNFIAVCDSQGYVLGGYSNVDGYPFVGFNCSEGAVGTNAIGTVLVEDKPLDVYGFEHYANIFQSWACRGAPIHDSSGRIVAVFNVTNIDELLPEWLSGLIRVGVQVIENQLYYRSEQHQVRQLRSMYSSLVDLIQECLIIIDEKGKISDANQKTLNLLGVSNRESLIGKSISEIIPHSEYELSNFLIKETT